MTTRTTQGKIKALLAEAFEVRSAPGSDFTIHGYASKPVVDRYNEVVDVEAFRGTLDAYGENPVLLNQHRTYEPIGRCTSLDLRHDGLFVEAIVGHGWAVADTVRRQIEQKIVKSFSIGFRETKAGTTDEDGVYHIVGLELLELSTVSVPACAPAIFEHDPAGKLLSIKMLDGTERRTARRPALSPGELAQLRTLQRGLARLTLQTQVNALRAADRKREAKRAELDATLARLKVLGARVQSRLAAAEIFDALDGRNGPISWVV